MVISKGKLKEKKKKLEAKPAHYHSVHHKHHKNWAGIETHIYHCSLKDEHEIWLPPQKHT